MKKTCSFTRFQRTLFCPLQVGAAYQSVGTSVNGRRRFGSRCRMKSTPRLLQKSNTRSVPCRNSGLINHFGKPLPGEPPTEVGLRSDRLHPNCATKAPM